MYAHPTIVHIDRLPLDRYRRASTEWKQELLPSHASSQRRVYGNGTSFDARPVVCLPSPCRNRKSFCTMYLVCTHASFLPLFFSFILTYNHDHVRRRRRMTSAISRLLFFCPPFYESSTVSSQPPACLATYTNSYGCYTSTRTYVHRYHIALMFRFQITYSSTRYPGLEPALKRDFPVLFLLLRF